MNRALCNGMEACELDEWTNDSCAPSISNRTAVKYYARSPPVVFDAPCEGAEAAFYDPATEPDPLDPDAWIWPLTHTTTFNETTDGVCEMTTQPPRDGLVAKFTGPRPFYRKGVSSTLPFTRVDPSARWMGWYAEIRVELLTNHPTCCAPPQTFSSDPLRFSLESHEETCGVVDAAVYTAFAQDYTTSYRLNATHSRLTYAVAEPRNDTACPLGALALPFEVSVDAYDPLETAPPALPQQETTHVGAPVFMDGGLFVGLSVGFAFFVVLVARLSVRYMQRRPAEADSQRRGRVF